MAVADDGLVGLNSQQMGYRLQYYESWGELDYIYERTDTGLVFQASIPRVVTPSIVFDSATDGQRIAVAATEGIMRILDEIKEHRVIHQRKTVEFPIAFADSPLALFV